MYIGTIIIFWICSQVNVAHVEFLEMQKGWFQFCVFTYSNILTMIKRTEHPILFTRRRSFGIIFLHSFNHNQDIIVHEITKLKSPLLLFDKLNMGNGDLSTNSEYDNCSNINFQLHHALNQVDLNTNLLDEVILT